MADIGEMLALRAQLEQEKQVAEWQQELARVMQRIDELKKRRAELMGLESGNNGEQTATI